MADFGIEVTGVRVEPYAAAPTLVWSMAITAPQPVHALALRVQIRIEPGGRYYLAAEQDRLLGLLGTPEQWGRSLHPFLWTHLDRVVPGFDGVTTVDLPMACTYDLEVAASQYLQALEGGSVPVVFLFSGPAFTAGERGFSVEPVSWRVEARHELPVATWREMMERYFPGAGWLRIDHETIDRLRRYRTEQALATWEETFARLLKIAGEDG
jgi:hypothetical protein